MLRRYQEVDQGLSDLITKRIADKIDAGRNSSNYSDWPESGCCVSISVLSIAACKSLAWHEQMYLCWRSAYGSRTDEVQVANPWHGRINVESAVKSVFSASNLSFSAFCNRIHRRKWLPGIYKALGKVVNRSSLTLLPDDINLDYVATKSQFYYYSICQRLI